MKIRPDTVDDFLAGKTAVVIGPGLGISQRAGELLEYIVASFGGKLVIDADGLNLLSRNLQLLRERRGDIIVTPHPKEMARLMGVEVEHVVSEPITYAVELARVYGITVLLKGSTTVVATPNGKARLLLNGNSGMAKGGSGDVLSGVIGSLCAQGISCTQSGVLGAFLCGFAADAALRQNSEYTLTPLDTIRHLKDGFAFLQGNREEDCPGFLNSLMQQEIGEEQMEEWQELPPSDRRERRSEDERKDEPLNEEDKRELRWKKSAGYPWDEQEGPVVEEAEEINDVPQHEEIDQRQWERETLPSQQALEDGLASEPALGEEEPDRGIHQGRKIKAVPLEEFAKLIATEDQPERPAEQDADGQPEGPEEPLA